MYGESRESAGRKEMKQLYDRMVMEPRTPASLSDAYRRHALQYLMFLKEKRDRAIKGRGCADGRKQR